MTSRGKNRNTTTRPDSTTRAKRRTHSTANVAGTIPHSGAVCRSGAILGAFLCALLLLATAPAWGASIEAISAANVSSTSADLRARINPAGLEQTYQFQTTNDTSFHASAFATATSTPQPPATLPPSNTPTAVSVHITGLTPNTTYHYQLTTTDTTSSSTTSTPAQFTTQPETPSQLGDNRGYELISPPHKNGGEILPPQSNGAPVESTPSGDGITYAASTAYENSVYGGFSLTQYLALHQPDGPWHSQSLTIPQRASAETVHGALYEGGFSEDLTKGLLKDADINNPPLAAGAIPGVKNLYITNNLHASPNPTENLQTITNIPPHPEIIQSQIHYNPFFESATPNLSHVVFSANDELTQPPSTIPPSLFPGAPNATFPQVYEWTAGELRLVNILPQAQGATATPEAALGGNENPEAFFLGRGQVKHAISDDGSKIFWTDKSTNPGNIYVRENGTSTIPVSASQKTNGSGPEGHDPNETQPARFWTASNTGSQAYFTSCEQLTNNATAASPGPNNITGKLCNPSEEGIGNDLYQFDTATRQLTDLTVDTTDTLGARVVGIVGASDDGSYVYFMANGVPDSAQGSGATPGNCVNRAGTCNLYLAHNNTITFITRLEPSTEEHRIDGTPLERPAYVTPDGHHLAFTVNTRLAALNTSPGGFDNTDANIGQPDSQIYLYNADTHALLCASCNITGGQPIGASLLDSWQTQTHHARSVSNDGTRVFFNSRDALLPGDTNQKQDVYEFETPGSGSCQSTAGCQYLISSGTSPDDSTFAEASTTGSNAFFTTTQALTTSDIDAASDLYNASVNATPTLPAGAPCLAEACKPSPTTLLLGSTPSSQLFNGEGNLVLPRAAKHTKKKLRCAKGKHASHGKCIKTHHTAHKTSFPHHG